MPVPVTWLVKASGPGTVHLRADYGESTLKEEVRLEPAPAPDLFAKVQESSVTWADQTLPFLWWTGGRVVGTDSAKGRDCFLVEVNAPAGVLQALAREGLLAISEEKTPPPGLGFRPGQADHLESPPPEQIVLTDAQREAVAVLTEALGAGVHRVFLLQGVTSSGKTEVYLRVLGEALARGRSGLVLVPEVALTPQTARRFSERFAAHGVAVLHSHLTDGERAEAWRAARAGRVRVVIGARSALFAPLSNLGLLVMDEEHETAFKQESAPRYHARVAALERARAAGAVVVLGSATPCLETYHAAQTERFTRLVLPERVRGLDLPPVDVVDMCRENRETKKYNYLSRALAEALQETWARGEQAILFINRRGWATVITCLHCGNTEHCKACTIRRTVTWPAVG
jgi:primosomal protein N' (replication factor Y)